MNKLPCAWALCLLWQRRCCSLTGCQISVEAFTGFTEELTLYVNRNILHSSYILSSVRNLVKPPQACFKPAGCFDKTIPSRYSSHLECNCKRPSTHFNYIWWLLELIKALEDLHESSDHLELCWESLQLNYFRNNFKNVQVQVCLKPVTCTGNLKCSRWRQLTLVVLLRVVDPPCPPVSC